MAYQVANVRHLHAQDTTRVLASRAPQPTIAHMASGAAVPGHANTYPAAATSSRSITVRAPHAGPGRRLHRGHDGADRGSRPGQSARKAVDCPDPRQPGPLGPARPDADAVASPDGARSRAREHAPG